MFINWKQNQNLSESEFSYDDVLCMEHTKSRFIVMKTLWKCYSVRFNRNVTQCDQDHVNPPPPALFLQTSWRTALVAVSQQLQPESSWRWKEMHKRNMQSTQQILPNDSTTQRPATERLGKKNPNRGISNSPQSLMWIFQANLDHSNINIYHISSWNKSFQI